MRNFRATVKEYGDGQPYVLIELDEDIGLGTTPLQGKQVPREIKLEFEKGASIEKAEAVAGVLNEKVSAFKLTKYT